MCRTFGVSPSGFYAWCSRPESTRAQEDRRLKVLVHASFTGGRGYYGSPRIYDDFVEWQEPVSRKRIIRLMQEDGLKARVRKRYKGTTMSDHDQPIADNLLREQFTAERPNQRWVGDTSELRIGESGTSPRLSAIDLESEIVGRARARERDAERPGALGIRQQSIADGGA
jgi:putative transposase